MNTLQIEGNIVEAFPMPFIRVDENGAILGLNKAAEGLIGHSRDTLIGKSHFEILHGTQDKDACPLFRQPLDCDQLCEVESEIRKTDGETMHTFCLMI